MKAFAALALLVASTDAFKLVHKSNSHNVSTNHHACDYIDDAGNEIETSLAVQLSS